ncbi:MAG: hypothetical protein WCI74_04635 [Actinomycetes bacterium]
MSAVRLAMVSSGAYRSEATVVAPDELGLREDVDRAALAPTNMQLPGSDAMRSRGPLNSTPSPR